MVRQGCSFTISVLEPCVGCADNNDMGISPTPSDRFRAAFEHAPIGLGLLDLDGRWLEVNAALCNLLEYSQSELLALDLDALLLPGSRRIELDQLGSSRPETRCRRSDGSAVWVAVSTTLVRDEARQPSFYVVQLEDISERKQAERELRRLADQDALTGLLNRRGFLGAMRRELRRMRRSGEDGALLSLDLDNFKQVNDSAGHAEGDRVLRHTADALRRRLRETDVVGRLGGDEFAVLLLDVAEPEARELAFELAQMLRTRVLASDGTVLDVRASIGLVTIDGTAVRSDEALLADADRAMYDAKLLNRVSAD
jgi:diguanylate cyclase (GGDEF)-like protein/PAS domain S-box-containing protein